ncbi:prostaglandin reductase 2-like [Ruditapes philippinarum]|uniref:prostaglandin reductase 2-like n=1 Tax=Ruditapes philippinarum TaxID=129788 RepID=UPI00295A5775|nr:prostaglandin reductase 2-like [Ruditapes philippinarum]
MESFSNSRVYLKSRPGADHEPSMENFGHETCPLPPALSSGEVTIKTLYISIDPAMRCRMNDETGVDYINAWQLGETIQGLGGVGEVIESKDTAFSKGDQVQGVMNWPWIKFFNTKTDDKLLPLTKVDAALKSNPQVVLSLFGVTGLTSYLGVKERGNLSPGKNQTFVVSGAAGACGNLAGQIGKLLGAHRVVGICGSDSKCSFLTTQLGFDTALNYKTENSPQRLKETCPEGIDAYFDNVGGTLSEEVIKQMNEGSHVILCGQIAVYNKDVPYPPPISQQMQDIISDRNITRERFLVLHFQDQFGDGIKILQEWYINGKLKVPEYIHEGLGHAGEAFVNMMTSVKQEKVGKQMVNVDS